MRELEENGQKIVLLENGGELFSLYSSHKSGFLHYLILHTAHDEGIYHVLSRYPKEICFKFEKNKWRLCVNKEVFNFMFANHRKDFSYCFFTEEMPFDETDLLGRFFMSNGGSVRSSKQVMEGFQFKEATFEKKVTFEKCFLSLDSFEEAFFKERVYFRNVTLTRKSKFSGINFGKGFTFFHSTFERNVDVSNLSFEEELNFEGVTFKEEADFRDTTFQSAVNFKETTFEKKVLFSDSSFEKEANFKYANFRETVGFSDIKCEGRFNLEKCSFGNRVYCNGIEVDSINLDGTRINKDILFSSSIIKKVENRETARIIKHEFIKVNDRVNAMEWHAKEMEKHLEGLKSSQTKGVCQDKILLYFQKWTSNYGQSWFKGIVWMFVLAFVISYLISSIIYGRLFPIEELWSNYSSNPFWNLFLHTLNPLHKQDIFYDIFPSFCERIKQKYNLILGIDSLGRVLMATLEFQVIQTFRRFMKGF